MGAWRARTTPTQLRGVLERFNAAAESSESAQPAPSEPLYTADPSSEDSRAALAEALARASSSAAQWVEASEPAAVSSTPPVARAVQPEHVSDAGSASGVPSSGNPVSGPRPPAAGDVVAPELGATTADPKRLSRLAWLKREVALEQLEQRAEQHHKTRKPPELPDGAIEWSEGRGRKYVQARAKARQYIDGRASVARARWLELVKDPATAHFAVGLKRICDAKGWTMAHMAARRCLAALEFTRELAVPICFNARVTSRPQRPTKAGRLRPGPKLGAVLGKVPRKFAPCVRGIAQPAFCDVIAWPGHTPEDDRAVNRKTVQRVMGLLEEFGLVQVVSRIPQRAAEGFEIGKSGHVINRYWIADRGSPKPALMAVWTLELEPRWLDVLDAPWLGATPRQSTGEDPPPIDA